MQSGSKQDEQTMSFFFFFEKVLHLSRPLNGEKTCFSSCRQLVPVFRSLLLAANGETCPGVSVNLLDLSSWKDVLRSLVQIESERMLLEKTILSASEAEQLLAVQYLLHLNEAVQERYHPLIGLQQIVIPLLISRTKDPESQDVPNFTLDVINGILDAVFLSTCKVPKDDDGALHQCLKLLVSTEQSDSLVLRENWHRSCLIIARLWETTPCIRSQLCAAVRDQIVFAVAAATASSVLRPEHFCTYRDFLRPLPNDLIPLLLENGVPLEYAMSVWKVATQLELQAESDPTLVLTIATTLACALLPSLRCQSSSSLVSDPWLWDLIQRCLAQGSMGLPMKETWQELSWNDAQRETKEPQNTQDMNNLEILRRRGLYLLRVLVEEEGPDLLPWKKYVACFETLEMESQPHLVDQVWKTLCELFNGAAENQIDSMLTLPPKVSWDWLKLILGRIITSEDSPTLRKLSLYRLFKGQAGILVTDQTHVSSSGQQQKKRESKNNRRKQTGNSAQGSLGAPMTMISNDFIVDVILPSYDTLSSTVGLMMHIEQNHKMIREDMSELLSNFIATYLTSIRKQEEALNDFVRRLWGPSCLCRLHRKTCVHVLAVSSKTLLAWKEEKPRLFVDSNMLDLMVSSFERLLSFGSVIPAYQDSIRLSLANSLAASATKGKLNSKSVLNILALYQLPPSWSMDEILNPQKKVDEGVEPNIESDAVSSWKSLGEWIRRCDETHSWAKSVAPAISTAFVDGLLTNHDPVSETHWDFRRGTSELERKLSKAVCMLCTLAASGQEITGGEMLWPAIHKGLTHVSASVLSSNGFRADTISRALLLLENGSKLQVISGLGNGDLVVDKRTQQMMPPPPNVESLLGSAVNFILYHIRKILAIDEIENESAYSQGARDDNARKLSSTFGDLIRQLHTLQEAFPSSLALSNSVENVLNENLDYLVAGSGERNFVLQTALVYAAMSCGAEVAPATNLKACKALLDSQMVDSTVLSRSDKTARSVFQYARWGALSTLLPQLFATAQDDAEIRSFTSRLVTSCSDVVEATPQDALVPLFSCVRISVKHLCTASPDKQDCSDTNMASLASMIDVLVRIMMECKNSSNAMLMLDKICGLIFQPSLLLEEYELARNDVEAVLPVKEAFLKFMAMAGTCRPHISRVVLSRICYGWLGDPSNNASGLGAIPYRDTIVELLLHKEIRISESSASQYELPPDPSEGKINLPPHTDDSSITRGFLLVFLSELPSVDCMDERVRSELVQYVMFQLLDSLKPTGEPLVMIGSPPYCLKMRGWQALCILTKYVSSDVAERICKSTFDALAESLHGQLRYFIEAFAIQCSRKHPGIFGRALVENIMRKNLSLQMISSLMILAGNLIVGHYEKDFFPSFINGDEGSNALDSTLSGVIPWLGSTQGFSRAIAQLLAHKLIPLVVDVSKQVDPKSNEWYLRSIYDFLDTNVEMIRIRKKQADFFSQFDTDKVCSVGGLLAIDVDEGGEADPTHMIDAIKQCLQEVYLDAHANDVPTWKIVEDMLKEQESPEIVDPTSDEVVNFQRKIIPVDALNLALESVKERRLRNVAGRKKQRLIVCASLVDKVPNLGGLARTAEIFAAEKLVIPDKRVAKMDNFKSLAVGADDWVEIEECKEEQLLEWLRKKRKQGYFIVGLEQTSSSVSLSTFEFPDRPTVLLLGKEKEGIPVEYLQAVNQCIEIPQLGIIRSLNVHVSGAIAIWEHTRQKIVDSRLTLS